MATIFTQIINGDLPGRFVHEDDECVAFLTIEPLSPGHTLVVPRREIDHWLDLEPRLLQHVTEVAQQVGQALERVYKPARVGMIIAGLEVPHVHIHVVPINTVRDLDFAQVDRHPNAVDLDDVQRMIVEALRH